eukprot:131205-Pelagomonas_calceolata.AAC.1
MEAAQWQHTDLFMNVIGKAVTNKLPSAIKLAHKLHAHSIMYANKLVTASRAIENNHTSHSQVMEPSASTNPPDPY